MIWLQAKQVRYVSAPVTSEASRLSVLELGAIACRLAEEGKDFCKHSRKAVGPELGCRLFVTCPAMGLATGTSGADMRPVVRDKKSAFPVLDIYQSTTCKNDTSCYNRSSTS